MMSALLIQNFWRLLKAMLASPVVLARMQKKYPTCHFYPGSYVDELSVLENYNVIFSNTNIINSVLGDHSFIQKNSMIINVDIGKFCSVAPGVHVGLAQHAIAHVSSHPAFYLLNTPLVKTFSRSDLFSTMQRTSIGHDVWIGQNAMIMGGVTIGTGSIVGAGSVVTRDIEPYAIVTGTPAKIVRYRFDEEIRTKLLNSKWWDMPEQWLQQNYRLFEDPLRLIEVLERPHG